MTAPTPSGRSLYGLASPLTVGEEELIGDPIYGETSFYQHTAAGDRARYRARLSPEAGMVYYNTKQAGPPWWGWFTTKNNDCATNAEKHDTDGDGEIETGTEAHCIPNGDYWVYLDRVTWDSSTGGLSSYQTIFRRRVALLDTLGALQHDSSNHYYHDARISFDLNSATTTLTGEIRAGDTWKSYIADTTDYYPLVVYDTIAGADSLWFIATFLAHGDDSRPWYENYTGLLTAFNFRYNYDQNAFGPAVNSVPVQSGPPPMLHVFTGAEGTKTYQVVGRVTEPYHDGVNNPGRDRTTQSLYITVEGVHACFTYSGTQEVGDTVSFDASCSSGASQLQFAWDFGDSSGTSSWTTSATAQHAYDSAATCSVVLSARRVARPADSDDTTRALTIAPSSFSASISGPDVVTESGYYEWDTDASGGSSPYHYHWHYKQGTTETDVGTDSPTYNRYVNARTAFFFRLRDSVTDAASHLDQPYFWVEVLPGGGLAPRGLLDATGRCDPLPSALAGRQVALETVYATGDWPTPCLVETP